MSITKKVKVDKKKNYVIINFAGYRDMPGVVSKIISL